MSSGSIVSGLVAAALSGSAASAPPAHPVRLVTSLQDRQLHLSVVGEDGAGFRGTYTLEVTSGASSNNRSVQRGRVALQPGQRAVLVQLSLGDAASDRWQAHLTVSDEGGHPLYEEQAS